MSELSGAVLSDCGRYRFSLWRRVEPTIFDGNLGNCLFVMNNPSTADANEDDPTIRRVKAFAASWGFSKVYVANTNPFRSTDPKKAIVPLDNVFAENDAWLRKLARTCQWVVAAWGTKAYPTLAARALNVLTECRDVRALALSKDGTPKHPLYLKGDLQPAIWRLLQKYSGDQK
jgi:hypothetical protein